MSYNSNSSSNESNKMEINNASNSKTTNEEQIEMTNTNSNNMSLDGGSTSPKLNTSPGNLSNNASLSSLCNSNKCTSSSSSDENTKPSKENTDSNNANLNSFSSNNDYEDEEEEEDEDDNNQYNSSNQSDEYRGETGGGGGSGEGGGSDSQALTHTDHEVTHTVSAYERLTKSVRSFLNATRILRTQLTQGSPESSAAEESSSNNQSLSPFSSASSASPPSSSSPSQSGLSPSMSSSNQSSSSSNHHRHHHHYHHHHSSLSNSDKFKNMTKKSNLFDELLKQCSESSATTNSYTSLSSNKKPCQKVNKTNLKNLFDLFKNNENYYSTMFFPITDNFKLESPKTRYTFRSSTSHASRRASKKETELISNGEDSNELNECQFAYNKQQDQQTANNNNNQITNNNTNNQTSSATNSTTTSNNNENNTHNTNLKLRSSEFFVCSICCHCLYEPITLVCGCSFCKSCLNEFNLTSIKLSLIKLAKKNAADSLNELDLLANSTNFDMKQTCSNSQSCTEGTSNGKGDCQSDSEDSSESSNDDNSNNNSETKFKSLSCHNLGLFKCYNCSRVHENNTAEYLKANTNIASIVEKLFQSKIENRKLRNDIRRYICLNLENNNNNTSNKTKHFDVNKYEKMFLFAYSLGILKKKF